MTNTNKYNPITEILNIIVEHRNSNNFTTCRKRYSIPFSSLNYNNDVRIIDMYKIRIEDFYLYQDIKALFFIFYECKQIPICEELL